MKKITLQDAKLMIKGASILACGGGLSYSDQLKYLKSLNFKKAITIIDTDELDQKKLINSVFVTASEIGPADDPPINKDKIPEMIRLFTKKYNKNIAGIIPVEIGQESIVFDTAIKSNLPIVNSDLAGLRAIPILNYNALTLQGIKFTRSPIIVLTDKGKIIAIDKNISIEKDEIILRQITKKNKGIIFVLGGFINVSMIKKYLKHPSLSIIKNLGSKIENNKKFSKVVPLSLVFSASGTIIKINQIKSLGFSQKELIIKTINYKNNLFTLKMKNEYMYFSNNLITFQFPQLITLYSYKLKRGLSGSELKENSKVEINIYDPMYP